MRVYNIVKGCLQFKVEHLAWSRAELSSLSYRNQNLLSLTEQTTQCIIAYKNYAKLYVFFIFDIMKFYLFFC